jgi:ABC-type lipoprotein export system ATPase subunit
MVTHNPDVSAGAQRVVHMRDGRVVDELSVGATS